jgi:RNA polymerase sigma-70 factor, ECF subfamily
MFDPTAGDAMSTIPAARGPYEEADLVRLVGERDERAFEALMRAHNRMLYRLARSILKDDAEAEDAVQEAYIAAYRNIASFRGGARLSTWLARIVINESYRRLRNRTRAGVVVPLGAQAHDAGTEPRVDEESMTEAYPERPDAAALRAEVRRMLERRIDALPEQFRTVFMLRDVEEMSVEETAEHLGIPAATVRTRAFRARALLRDALSRELDVATVEAFGFAGERCDRIVANVLARVRAIP